MLCMPVLCVRVVYACFVCAGVFYFMLGNLNPKYRSRYSSINLLALCKRKVMTKYSMSSILRPIIDDLKLLVSRLYIIKMQYYCVLLSL